MSDLHTYSVLTALHEELSDIDTSTSLCINADEAYVANLQIAVSVANRTIKRLLDLQKLEHEKMSEFYGEQ